MNNMIDLKDRMQMVVEISTIRATNDTSLVRKERIITDS